MAGLVQACPGHRRRPTEPQFQIQTAPDRLQRNALTRAGCTRLYEDSISGAKAARPALQKSLAVQERRVARALILATPPQ